MLLPSNVVVTNEIPQDTLPDGTLGYYTDTKTPWSKERVLDILRNMMSFDYRPLAGLNTTRFFSHRDQTEFCSQRQLTMVEIDGLFEKGYNYVGASYAPYGAGYPGIWGSYVNGTKLPLSLVVELMDLVQSLIPAIKGKTVFEACVIIQDQCRYAQAKGNLGDSQVRHSKHPSIASCDVLTLQFELSCFKMLQGRYQLRLDISRDWTNLVANPVLFKELQVIAKLYSGFCKCYDYMVSIGNASIYLGD